MSNSNQRHLFRKMSIDIIGLILLVIGGMWFVLSLGEIQKHVSLLALLPLPTPTLAPTETLVPGQLRTRYLTGTYPSSWVFSSDTMLYHSPLRGDKGSALWGCSGDAESDEIEKASIGNVYLLFCPTRLSDPETLLVTISPTIDSSAIKYIPRSATPSVRFGRQGLRGTWMRGVEDRYVPEYFEVYVRDNHLLLISTPYGDNKAFEDVLANIKPNL